ncbi:MAG: glycine--tRNA ligase subunit beta [Bacillota bacterium]|nr:glycine--tRNA ligase subunit beta [Bacillota bacterium]
MSDFLLEIGVEELPAAYVLPGVGQLGRLLRQALAGARIEAEEPERWATPRRLAVRFRNLPERQPDREWEVRGPAASVAFDAQGRPTRAGEGFARSQGVPVEALEVRETEQGAYVFARRRETGLPTAQLLARLVPEAVASIDWPRSMRWGSGSFRFARPIRWCVALLGESVVPLELDGVRSGRESRGLRVHHPEPVVFASAADYPGPLEAAGVLADPEERRSRLLEAARQAAHAAGGTLVEEAELVDEVTQLVEWPSIVLGRFDPAFLEVPEEVLITTLRHHQRCFPVRGAHERLLPLFIAVRNGGGEGAEQVRHGNEKVVRARLSDAAFFWREDLEQPLEAMVERLRGVHFHEGLGSLYDKTGRVRRLVGWLAETLGMSAEVRRRAERAAWLAKADLVSRMVYEFPELQGIMGGHYAARGGEPAGVAQAIREQYLPAQAGDPLPASVEGRLLAVADRLDTLAGLFAAGEQPSGSQDPLGLRRQASGLIAILLEAGWPVGIEEALEQALALEPPELTEEERGRVRERLLDFLAARIRVQMTEEGLEHDVIDAVLAGRLGVLPDLWRRARAVAALAGDGALAADVLTVFRRAANLAREESGGERRPSRELLVEPEERLLYDALEVTEPRLQEAVAAADYSGYFRLLASLRSALDPFLDKVLVMAEDPALRANRLALLGWVKRLAALVADLGRLSGERGQAGPSRQEPPAVKRTS